MAEDIKKQKEKKSVDFKKIFEDIRKYKKTYYKVLAIVFVLAVIYAMGKPKYYTCTVKLSPELSTSRNNSLSVLASSFGLNMGSGFGAMGSEALFPTVYPELMESVDFKASLFEVPVTIEPEDEDEEPRTISYYDYLKDEQKQPWWSAIISGTLNTIIDAILPLDTTEVETKIDPFRLTKKQEKIARRIEKLVDCKVDKKTMVITITVTDQDPVICATMADTVKTRLQNFITDYRTNKSRVDLEYNRKIYKEAKRRYEHARQLYAEYMDANHDVILNTVRQRQTDLENEMQLQYNTYAQIAAQLLAAEAKVQQDTPAFTTLQSATVPVKKAGPKRLSICIVFLFLGFVGTTLWVLNKEKDLKPLLGIK